MNEDAHTQRGRESAGEGMKKNGEGGREREREREVTSCVRTEGREGCGMNTQCAQMKEERKIYSTCFASAVCVYVCVMTHVTRRVQCR